MKPSIVTCLVSFAAAAVIGCGKTEPVGSYQSNAWGLHDMHGNVWEWCEDIYKVSYSGLSDDGSANVTDGDLTKRVFRGGSWADRATELRSASRAWALPAARLDYIGIRLVARQK